MRTLYYYSNTPYSIWLRRRKWKGRLCDKVQSTSHQHQVPFLRSTQNMSHSIVTFCAFSCQFLVLTINYRKKSKGTIDKTEDKTMKPDWRPSPLDRQQKEKRKQQWRKKGLEHVLSHEMLPLKLKGKRPILVRSVPKSTLAKQPCCFYSDFQVWTKTFPQQGEKRTSSDNLLKICLS